MLIVDDDDPAIIILALEFDSLSQEVPMVWVKGISLMVIIMVSM